MNTSELIDLILHVIQNPDESLIALFALKNIHIDQWFITNMNILKNLYQNINQIYNNPSNLNIFIQQISISVKANLPQKFNKFPYVFAQFYTLLTHFIERLLQTPRGMKRRHYVIKNNLEQADIAIKYDYYFNGSIRYTLSVLSGIIDVLPDGRIIAGNQVFSGGKYVLDVKTNKITKSLVLSNNKVVSGTINGHVFIWNPTTGETVMEFDSHDRRPVISIITLSNNRIAYISENNLSICDLDTPQPLFTVNNPKLFKQIDLLPNGKILALLRNRIIIYDPDTGLEEKFKTFDTGIDRMSVLGNRIILSTDLKLIFVDIDLWDYTITANMRGDNGFIQQLYPVSDKVIAIVFHYMRQIQLRNIDTLRLEAEILSKKDFLTCIVKMLIIDNYVAVGTLNGNVQIHDIKTGELKYICQGTSRVVSIKNLPDGALLVIHENGTLNVWE